MVTVVSWRSSASASRRGATALMTAPLLRRAASLL